MRDRERESSMGKETDIATQPTLFHRIVTVFNNKKYPCISIVSVKVTTLLCIKIPCFKVPYENSRLELRKI
jgi:hypothetical protein